MILEPLIKWAGGKRQIMNKILVHFPKDFNNYHEPFVGAGSVFMEMNNRRLLDGKNIYISDLMKPLINLYEIVKLYPDELINNLSSEIYLNNIETFNELKQRFNELKKTEENPIELAALFIYLNKTGFNGMYRENSKGDFNISFGKQTNPCIYKEETIKYLSDFLNKSKVFIRHCNFIDTENTIEKGDFIYMDPPYYGTFTGYNKEEFGKEKQKELRDFFVKLSKKGCKVALSNSNDNYIKELYSNIDNVKFIEIEVKRMINSNGLARGEMKKELLIINYN